MYRFALDKTGEFKPALISSPLRALYRTSDSEGEGWALVVQVIDERGLSHNVLLPYSEIATEPSAAVARMAAVGLQIHAKPELVLGAVRYAHGLERAYTITKPGHHTVGGASIFALPRKDGIIGKPPSGETFLWKGSSQFCRVRQAGTFDGWKNNVAAPLNGIPIPMTMIGTLLASTAIPFLPSSAELNTVLHLFGDNSKGKTTALQCGASVWGMGAKSDVEGSFLNIWKTTQNSVESLMLSGRHIGACLDEIKTLDAKAGPSLAYDISGGRRKARMNADGSQRPAEEWSLFLGSSGELKREEIGNSDGRRRPPPDGGGAARFIDIPGHDAFSGLSRQQDPKAFVEAMGAAASTDYGHAGPRFAGWLIANPAEARAWLKDCWPAWMTIAMAILPPAASPQATRVATRLGSIACAAALAAAVLELPWSAGRERIGQVVAAVVADADEPAKATLWAFAKVLELWLGENGGGGASTEIADLSEELRNLYASHPSNLL